MKNTLKVILSIILVVALATAAVGFSSTPVKSIKLNNSKITMDVGQTFTLKVTITPSNATNKTVLFTTSNNKVATVDKNGKITAIKTGNAVITAVSSSNKKILAKCSVTISQLEIFLLPQQQVLKSGSLIQKEIEKACNVKLKFSDVDAYSAEQMNLLFASGNLPDVMILVSTSYLVKLAQQGLIREIPEQMVRQNAPYISKSVDQLDKGGWVKASYDDKLYGLPSVWADGALPFFSVIRKDWVDKVGGSVSEVMTIDQLESIFTKFVNNDPDGNGKKDTHAFSGPLVRFSNVLFGAFGVSDVNFIKKQNGTLAFSGLEPGFTNALKTFARWYKLGIIDPEFPTETPSTYNDKFASGKLGYACGNCSQINWALSMSGLHPVFALMSKDPANKSKLAYITQVKGPDGSYGSLDYAAAAGYNVVLSNKVDDAKAAKILQFFDKVNSDEKLYKLICYGIEGIDYKMAAEGYITVPPELTDNLKKESDEKVLRPDCLFPIHPLDRMSYRLGPLYKQIYESANPPRRYVVGSVPGWPTETGQQYWSNVFDVTNEYITNTIMGKTNVTGDYDAYVQKIKSLKIETMTKEYNDLYKKVYGK